MKTNCIWAMVLLIGMTSCKTEDHLVKKSKRKEIEPNNLQIPDAVWVDVYLEEVFERTKIVKLVDLRKKSIDEKGVEIRIWFHSFFAEPSVSAVVLEKKPFREYSGSLVKNSSESIEKIDKVLGGWSMLFQTLKDNGLVSLPGGSTLELGKFPEQGGPFYVIEVLQGSNYRAFGYSHCQLADKVHGYKLEKILRKVLWALEIQSPYFI